MDSRNPQFLDEVLERSLRAHGQAAAPDGIEFRLLARIRAAQESRARKWRIWLWMPVPVIAVLLIAAVFFRTAHNQAVRTPFTTVAGPAVAPGVPATFPARRVSTQVPPRGYHRAQRLISNDRTVRRRQVFPSPAPLSEQEMALIAITEAHSAEKIAGLAVPMEPDPPVHNQAPDTTNQH